MADLGTDVATPDGDIDALGTLASGVTLLCQDLVARIETPPGGLYYDPQYGYGLLEHVGEEIHRADAAKLWRIEDGVAAECSKDERVRSVEVAVEIQQFDATKSRLLVTVTGTSADGPFRLVLAVDNVSIEVLEAGAP